jgi:hypothetical protein
MSEMIERVARAMFSSIRGTEVTWEGEDGVPRQHIYRELTRAAIQAMREPTKEMIEGGRIALLAAQGSTEAKFLGEASNAKWVWIEMIDEALRCP